MASKVAAAPQPIVEQPSARAKTQQETDQGNEKNVRANARRYLGHIYYTNTGRNGEMAVEKIPEDHLLVKPDVYQYEAIFHSTKETALERWKNSFDFTMGATIPVGPKPKIEAGLDISRTTINSSDSSTVFCTVVCVNSNECHLQKLPNRLDVKAESTDAVIARTVKVYAGYRLVLEITCSSNKSEKKTTAGVKAKGSTLSTIIGGNIDFKNESSSLNDRNIEQINIIASDGYAYPVPSPGIVEGDDFPAIQAKFETIRQNFLKDFFTLARRHCHVIGQDPFSEIPQSAPRASLPVTLETEHSESPVLPRDTASRNSVYYTNLANNIRAFLKGDLSVLTRDLGSLQLEHMLYGIEIAFSNLLNLPDKKAPVLLMGTQLSTLRRQGARLRGEGLAPVCPQNAFNDAFNPELKTILRIYAHENVLEISRFVRELSSPEYTICLGVATNYLISRFAPMKVMVCIPREFFQADSLNLIENVIALHKSVEDLVRNPESSKKGILFIMDDQQNEPNFASKLKKEVHDALNTLNAERARRGAGWWWWMRLLSMRGGPDPQAPETDRAKAQIIQALEAYAFIVNRLAFSSNAKELLNGNFSSLSSDLAFEVTEDFASNYSIRERALSHTFVDLSLWSFNKNNISPRSSDFELVLIHAIRYMRHLENQVDSFTRASDSESNLIKIYEKVIEALTKNELEKITPLENELKEVTQAVKELSSNKQSLKKEISETAAKIKENKDQIEKWKINKEPTPYSIECPEYIQKRSFWSLFPKRYTFQTTEKTSDFIDCTFNITHGEFDCTPDQFKTAKKAVFTPDHYGYESKAEIVIRIEKCKHPATLDAINDKHNENLELEQKAASLKDALTKLESAILVLRSQKIKDLESELTKKRTNDSRLKIELTKSKQQRMQYLDYYEILKSIYLRHSHAKTTKYYGLTHTFASPTPEIPYVEKHKAMQEIAKHENRLVYIITEGNKEDQSFGTDSPREPLFYEYTGKGVYLPLEAKPGQAREIAKQIEQNIAREAK